MRNLNEAHILDGHRDEVLDVAFDYTGRRVATASSDGTAKIWDATTNYKMLALIVGHTDEVSKVCMSQGNHFRKKYSFFYLQICFSPPGGVVLTASSDRTAKLWDSNTGKNLQTLAGHDSDVFSCAFNYAGDAIVTASKDNTCKIWR